MIKALAELVSSFVKLVVVSAFQGALLLATVSLLGVVLGAVWVSFSFGWNLVL